MALAENGPDQPNVKTDFFHIPTNHFVSVLSSYLLYTYTVHYKLQEIKLASFVVGRVSLSYFSLDIHYDTCVILHATLY